MKKCISAALVFFAIHSYGSLADAGIKVLIFGKTIRQTPHGVILPLAGPGLEHYLAQNGVEAVFTQDLTLITKTNLEPYNVLALIDVSEGVLNSDQQKTIESFFSEGRGIVAIHASISAGKDWPWFHDLLGTKFIDHAPIQNGVVRLSDPQNPSFSKFPAKWTQFDEWFNFSDQIKPPREIVYLSQETTYQGGKMGSVHPVAWRLENSKGHFFYTSMGHPAELYTKGENEFLRMILLAVRWAATAQ